MNDRVETLEEPASFSGGGPDPDLVFGALFDEVQSRRIFPDGKTFPDMEPLLAPNEILLAWREKGPVTDAELKAFVEHHFAPPTQRQPLSDHIRSLWDDLVRYPDKPGPYSTSLELPRRYLVPGGRFRELYYWDSYFSSLGLLADGRDDLVDDVIENFVWLVENYGHVPNGARTYFLTRSQPPVLALMTRLSRDRRPDVRERRLAALLGEHAYWMAGAEAARRCGAAARVVVMPNGALLNRYWDRSVRPRPESYVEDLATARTAARGAGLVFRDLRAAAESGWDFSSRWLADPYDLGSIRTTAIVPVDLNSLLYFSERTIASLSRDLGEIEQSLTFDQMADARAMAIHTYLWSGEQQAFCDWITTEDRRSDQLTAASLYPLFVGLATMDQARAVARRVDESLLAPGGLRTTTRVSGQQWDAPNGWAPLQWIGIRGLRRYGEETLASAIAERWLTTVSEGYAATGVLSEKYDIETAAPAGGGEYPNQIGFGWTNGVVQALLCEEPERLRDAL